MPQTQKKPVTKPGARALPKAAAKAPAKPGARALPRAKAPAKIYAASKARPRGRPDEWAKAPAKAPTFGSIVRGMPSAYKGLAEMALKHTVKGLAQANIVKAVKELDKQVHKALSPPKNRKVTPSRYEGTLRRGEPRPADVRGTRT